MQKHFVGTIVCTEMALAELREQVSTQKPIAATQLHNVGALVRFWDEPADGPVPL
jgi:hypothetical protein